MKTKLSILAELDPQSVWKEIEQFFDEHEKEIFLLKEKIYNLEDEIKKLNNDISDITYQARLKQNI